ncbi:hypothetical protein [Prevotella sp. 10(H)]|nr:hypothetical protein [Prevotella sp. 10(H)]
MVLSTVWIVKILHPMWIPPVSLHITLHDATCVVNSLSTVNKEHSMK